MDKFTKLLTKIRFERIIASIIFIVISIVLYRIVSYVLDKGENNDKVTHDKKSKTYIRLLKNIIRNVFIIVTILLILQINGVNVSSILAGIGIAGVIVGLAIQDWLKDIIRGATILADHYFAVGDIVKYADIEGQVVVIGLRTTKIRDIVTGNFVCIANRNIDKAEIVSGNTFVIVPLPYEVKLKEAESIIDEIISNIKKNVNGADNASYLGIKEFGESSINYLVQIESKVSIKRQVKRDAHRALLEVLEKHKISIPYKQVDIHQK